MQIKRAEIADIEKIVPLFLQYRDFYKRSREPEASRQFLLQRLSANESVIYLAIDETDAHQAMGFAQLFPSFSSLALQRLWILNDLFVAPEFRRQNVGRELLKACEELARETRARGLTLQTAVDNHPAQRLYESMNWKKVDQFYAYILTV